MLSFYSHLTLFKNCVIFFLLQLIDKEIDGNSRLELVYCSNNNECLPFSYCKTLHINSEIQLCRWGSGEPYICCNKSHSSECGVTSSDVAKATIKNVTFEAAIGGFPVKTAKSTPWMVAVGEEIEPKRYDWFCGGCLVTKNRALTAAHCLEHRQADIARFGELDFSSSLDDAAPYDVVISGVVIHPQYQSPSLYNDIALLQLKEDLKFNDYIMPICLPKLNSYDNYEGSIATLIGWGRTTFENRKSYILQEVSVTVVNNSGCSALYMRPDVRRFHYPLGIIDSQLCAGDSNGGKDACQGDSGGPLLVINNGVHVVIGIVSSGFGCGSKTFPGVYTRVSSFSKWITDHL